IALAIAKRPPRQEGAVDELYEEGGWPRPPRREEPRDEVGSFDGISRRQQVGFEQLFGVVRAKQRIEPQFAEVEPIHVGARSLQPCGIGGGQGAIEAIAVGVTENDERASHIPMLGFWRRRR